MDECGRAESRLSVCYHGSRALSWRRAAQPGRKCGERRSFQRGRILL